MTCTSPIKAWRGPNGPVFNPRDRYLDVPDMLLPCNNCMACRVTRNGQWKTRLYHEGMMHELSSFITLTYNDDYLPDDYSVQIRAAQLFIKRLRKHIANETGNKIRFFGCGEYGDFDLRPHYHELVFGYDFPDKYYWSTSAKGHALYRSPTLEKLWPFGFSNIGAVTPQTCGYVSGYMLKKINGQRAEEHYKRVHPLTGEVCRVRPEFIHFSNRPGIGGKWFDTFACDAFPSDFVVVDGDKVAVPKYYTKKLEFLEEWRVKARRIQSALSRKDDNTPERLAVKEEVLRLKIGQVKGEL